MQQAPDQVVESKINCLPQWANYTSDCMFNNLLNLP